MKFAFLTLILVAFALPGADTPDALRDRGLEALRAAQSDDAKVVEAAQLLAQAAEAYEKAGKDNQAADLNAYLYWCKKRMTLSQAESFSGRGDSGRMVTSRLAQVEDRKVEASEASKWLERADSFSEAHPSAALLCAIRYFEVADRFAGSQESLIAQKKSLDLIGRHRGPSTTIDKSPVKNVQGETKDFSPVRGLTLKFDSPTVKNIVDACKGRQWLMKGDGPKFPLGKIPPSLQGSWMIQPTSHAWICGFETNRPITVCVAIRTQWGNVVDVSDHEIANFGGGWVVLRDQFALAGVGASWKWKIIGKRFLKGKVVLDRPYSVGTTAVIFFIR